MSDIALTIIIASVICVGIALIVYAQAREAARIERVRKITLYDDRHKKIQELLSELPPQYLSNEMRLLLSEQSMRCIQELHQLKPSPQNSSYIAEDQARIRLIQTENPSYPAVKLDDDKAKEARDLLQDFYKLLHIWLRTKKIPAKQAKMHISQVVFLAHKSNADVYATIAQAAEAADKVGPAIHNYHAAIDALTEVMQHPEAISTVDRYQEEITRLKLLAEQNSEKIKADSQAALEQSNEWNNLLNDDESWKKKNNYDD